MMTRLILTMLLALAVAGLTPGSSAGQGGPIKIGLLAPLSGAFSADRKSVV